MSPELNPDQRAAVEGAPGAMAVVAGAGSGKTRVLTHRYVRLVADLGVEPSQILALTFTEKAAVEMRGRIRDAFARRGDRRRARAVAAAPISTIHGLCARLLREHALTIGLDPAFTVLEEWRAGELRRETLGRLIARWRADRPQDLEAIRALRLVDQTDDFFAFHDALRAAGADAETLVWAGAEGARDLEAGVAALQAGLRAARAREDLAEDQRDAVEAWLDALTDWEDERARTPLEQCARLAPFPKRVKLNRGNREVKSALRALRDQGNAVTALLVERFVEGRAGAFADWVRDFDALYGEIKRGRSVLDFSDLEHEARALLRRDPSIRAALDIRHLLVDEYQDTNPIQEEILAALEPEQGRFAVGDQQQAIYGFRHADVRIMEGFVDGIDARARVSLDRNYRSRPEVLAFINGLLAGCRRVQFRALTAELPPAGDGPRVHVAMARADTVAEARQIEADWIAARVVERLARGAALRDMAVLLRWTSGADLYERKLNEAGIDAHVDRGGAVLSTQEAAELTALLRVVDRPDDALAMAIVLKSPLCGLSDLGLYHLLWDQPPESLARTLRERVDLLTGADRARMDAFVAWWPRALGGAGRRAPAEIVREAVAASDYLVRLAWGADGEERVANAEQFLDVLGRYDPGPGPRDALELLDRLRREDWKDRPVPGGEGDDRVRIQTVHAAKGLEFPIVFVADLANSRKTTPPPYYLFEPPGRFALAVSNPHAKRLGLSGAKMAPASYAALNAIHQQRAEAENARLLYVALTRAQEHLYLSAACRTSKWTGWAGEFLQGIEIDDERGPEERAVPGAPEASYTFTFLTDSGAAPASFEAKGVVTELPTDAERALAGALIDAARRPMPSAHGPHEVITATELLAFVECPRRYFLEQVLGRATSRRSARDASVPEPADEAASDPGSDELDPSGAVGAAELGVAAHALLETWRPERGDPLDATAEAVCRAHGVGSARDRRALMEWAEGFHASDLGRRARDAERVHRELPFASRVGGVEVRGTIDLLWFERDGTPVLVDYKTTVTDAARRRAAGPIYGLQLALYALAIERAGWGTAREGYLYYLRDGAVETVDLSTEALDRALGWIDALLGAQRAGAYPPADPPCARCPHPARCARSGPGL